MPESENLTQIVSLLNRYVQSICGLYSRVARGERRSQAIEQGLNTQFDRIMSDDNGQAT
jgi:hypothetical protein